MSHLDDFRADLASALAHELGTALASVEQAVATITAEWAVERKDFHHGHRLIVTPPFIAESDTERIDREAARVWGIQAWVMDFDPMDAASGCYAVTDDDPGPPPIRVGVMQLLNQGLWWRMADPQGECGPGQRNPTVAVRIADMEHSHRLSLLAFLRRNAEIHKGRRDWYFASVPGPSGDMASDAFEDAVDQQFNTPAGEWLEDQPLIKALVYWTTPYAESPLTWRPMDEAPRDGTTIVVRWTDSGPLDEPDRVYWRELRDDEQPERALCGHGIDHNTDHCLNCEAAQDAEA